MTQAVAFGELTKKHREIEADFEVLASPPRSRSFAPWRIPPREPPGRPGIDTVRRNIGLEFQDTTLDG